jgi:hypothetical protein
MINDITKPLLEKRKDSKNCCVVRRACRLLYADDVLREHIRASVTTLASTLANLTAISLASHLLSSIRIIIINNNSSNTHSQ